MGLPRRQALSVKSGKGDRLPRSGEPRGGRSAGASGAGDLERAADRRPLGHRLRPGARVIFCRADAGRSDGSTAVPRDTRPAADAHSCPSGPRIPEFEGAAGEEHRPSEVARGAAKAGPARPPRGPAGGRPPVSRRFPPGQRIGRRLAAPRDRLARRVPRRSRRRRLPVLSAVEAPRPGYREPYLDAYCRIANVQQGKILDWLPYVAAARLAEDAPDDLDRLLELVRS